MKEEHTVITTDRLKVGQQVPLIPRYGCTAAYLYDRSLVRDCVTAAGSTGDNWAPLAERSFGRRSGSIRAPSSSRFRVPR